MENHEEETRYITIGHSYAMAGKLQVEIPKSLTDRKEIIAYIREHEDEYPIHPCDEDYYLDGSYKVDEIYWDDGEIEILE